MEISDLIQNLIPLISALNQNNNSQSEKNNSTLQPKNSFENKADSLNFNSPFFTLPTYQFDPKNQQKQDLNYSQNLITNSQQPDTITNVLNVLSKIDLSKLIPLLSSLLQNNKPNSKQQKKDTDVPFNNTYTKVETFNYDEL